MSIFLALYNPCIDESGFVTISIHHSKEGAEEAARRHKENRIADFTESYAKEIEEYEAWKVIETEILP